MKIQVTNGDIVKPPHSYEIGHVYKTLGMNTLYIATQVRGDIVFVNLYDGYAIHPNPTTEYYDVTDQISIQGIKTNET